MFGAAKLVTNDGARRASKAQTHTSADERVVHVAAAEAGELDAEGQAHLLVADQRGAEAEAAAVLKEKSKFLNKKVGVILSGGNVDIHNVGEKVV